jgi:predicted dehydrogenase
MVNLTYRNSPAIQEARRMVQSGEIGELRHVEASYRQSWLVSQSWGDCRVEDKWLWRLSIRHGSTGVLGDVGIHILDFAAYGADQDIVSLHADLVTFPKAEGERIHDCVMDANDSVAMTARLNFGALATIVASRYMIGHANELSLALHSTKAPSRSRPTARYRTCPPAWWGCRSSALADAAAAQCQAQCPVLCRCVGFRPERRSLVPARRRHAEADRRRL